jgi:hypothetical protein
LALNGSGNDHESIEPTSGLIKAFSNKVGWETFHEFFIIDRERVVALSERHCTTFKPAIKDFWDSSKHALAHLGWNGDVIYCFSMQVSEWTAAGKLSQLSDRANTDNFFHII